MKKLEITLLDLQKNSELLKLEELDFINKINQEQLDLINSALNEKYSPSRAKAAEARQKGAGKTAKIKREKREQNIKKWYFSQDVTNRNFLIHYQVGNSRDNIIGISFYEVDAYAALLHFLHKESELFTCLGITEKPDSSFSEGEALRMLKDFDTVYHDAIISKTIKRSWDKSYCKYFKDKSFPDQFPSEAYPFEISFSVSKWFDSEVLPLWNELGISERSIYNEDEPFQRFNEVIWAWDVFESIVKGNGRVPTWSDGVKNDKSYEMITPELITLIHPNYRKLENLFIDNRRVIKYFEKYRHEDWQPIIPLKQEQLDIKQFAAGIKMSQNSARDWLTKAYKGYLGKNNGNKTKTIKQPNGKKLRHLYLPDGSKFVSSHYIEEILYARFMGGAKSPSNLIDPLFSYTGGKRWLKDKLWSATKTIVKTKYISKYCEPFAGALGSFLSVQSLIFNKGLYIEHVQINDANPELIGIYEWVKYDYTKLLEEYFAIDKKFKEYIPLEVQLIPKKIKNEKTGIKDINPAYYGLMREAVSCYYRVQKSYNTKKAKNTKRTAKQSAQLLFLLTYALRGIYSEDKEMNVTTSFNYFNSKIDNLEIEAVTENVVKLSNLFRAGRVELTCLSYEQLEYNSNTLYYLDPPYMGSGNYSDASPFSEEHQIDLIKRVKDCCFIYSNYNHPKIEEALREITPAAVIDTVDRENPEMSGPEEYKQEEILATHVPPNAMDFEPSIFYSAI